MRRCLFSLCVLATAVAIVSPKLSAQATPDTPKRAEAAKAAWTPPRTPDGQPDLRGMWVNFDSTPFETPGNAPRRDTSETGPAAAVAGTGPPSHWTEHNSPMPSRRQAMVVDPPDGRVPVMRWAEEKRDYDLDHIADAWEHQTPWERCITRGMPAGMFPAGYNNAYQILQIPGYVVIRYEMIHEARIIPLDGRPHVGSRIRMWNGDPRGHWEGNTLVVETTNYNDKGSIATSAATARIRGIPQSEALHVVERFTPVSANTITWEVTIEDPKVYANRWKVVLPLTRDEKYQMFEYSCAEGNLAMANTLSGGRAQER